VAYWQPDTIGCVSFIYILIECVSILKYLNLPDLLSALILLYFVLLVYVTFLAMI
jgi:hypothetical protein